MHSTSVQENLEKQYPSATEPRKWPFQRTVNTLNIFGKVHSTREQQNLENDPFKELD